MPTLGSDLDVHASLAEAQSLAAWLGPVARAAHQRNQPFESDCELLDLQSNAPLAITVDSLSEEIACGLYQEGYTQGWVAAAASLSDLAAVGATPLGLLFSAVWGPNCTLEHRREVARGLKDCLAYAGVALLGGDSGRASSTVLTTVGVGQSHTPRPITRLGIQADDLLVLSGPIGHGPALAYRLLLGLAPATFSETAFRPALDLQVKKAFAKHARAMIDTSDGCLAACHTLCELNQLGLLMSWSDKLFTPKARAFAQQCSLPAWALWLAEHGDYQLLAAVAPSEVQTLLAACPQALVVGRFRPRPGIFLHEQNHTTRPVKSEHAFLVATTPAADRQRVCQQLLASLRAEGYP